MPSAGGPLSSPVPWGPSPFIVYNTLTVTLMALVAWRRRGACVGCFLFPSCCRSVLDLRIKFHFNPYLRVQTRPSPPGHILTYHHKCKYTVSFMSGGHGFTCAAGASNRNARSGIFEHSFQRMNRIWASKMKKKLLVFDSSIGAKREEATSFEISPAGSVFSTRSRLRAAELRKIVCVRWMTRDHPDQQHGPLISSFPPLFCVADIKADFCAMTPQRNQRNVIKSSILEERDKDPDNSGLMLTRPST